MTCRQLFVLQCDHTWLRSGGSLVSRCHRELLGSEGEDSADVRLRGRGLGWSTGPPASRDLCPLHNHVGQGS